MMRRVFPSAQATREVVRACVVVVVSSETRVPAGSIDAFSIASKAQALRRGSGQCGDDRPGKEGLFGVQRSLSVGTEV